ncbi:MAG: tetratricopeptide repeat protein [Alphaproteobacteria bacterium]|nr:tetratricopeptide repeat protein [Alphaproteobacteria bacterium]
MESKSHPSRKLRVVSILSFALAVGFTLPGHAATSGPEGVPGLQSDIMGPSFERGSTTAGRFLAARHAEVVGDLVAAADMTSEIIGLVPETGTTRRRAHLLMVSAGRFSKAAELAKEVLETNPADPIATYTLHLIAMREGRFTDAAALLTGVTTSGVNGVLFPLLKAWALAGQGQTDDALLELQTLASEASLAPIAELHQAYIADLGGELTRAEASFRLALERSNGRPSLQLVDSFARFLMRQDKSEEARALVLTFAEQNPDTLLIEPAQRVVDGADDPDRIIADVKQGAAEVFRNVSGLLNRERLRTEALVFVRMSLGLEPDNPTALFSLGQLLELRLRDDLAIDVYRKIGDDTPYSWYARLSIADALHSQKKSKEAIAILRGMVGERADRSDAMRILADMLSNEKRFDEAIEAYDLAYERLRGNADWRLFYTRGIALEQAKRWDRAEKDFLTALDLEPGQPLVLNYLGYSWVEQGVNLDRAKTMIAAAVAKRPEDGYITDSLGWVLYRLGEYSAAVDLLERAVALEPGDPVINDHLGDAYWIVGRRNEAQFQWIRTLSLDPPADVKARTRLKLEGKKEPSPLPPGKNRDI